jgi:hypothetical protein
MAYPAWRAIRARKKRRWAERLCLAVYTAAAATSFLLAVAVTTLWIRSYWTAECCGRRQVLRSHDRVHTLTISHWIAVAAFTLLPGLWLWQFRAQRRMKRKYSTAYCGTRGYDLRASKDRCPECGTPIPCLIRHRGRHGNPLLKRVDQLRCVTVSARAALLSSSSGAAYFSPSLGTPGEGKTCRQKCHASIYSG